MIFYIKEGNVLVSADYMGAATKRICDGVSNADYCTKTRVYVITLINGVVETRDYNGNRIRQICDGATESRFNGGLITVRRNGRTELRDRSGNLQKYI